MTTSALTSARVSHRSRREEGGKAREQLPEHKSVLLEETLKALELKKEDTVLDATLGLGGHSEAILKAMPVRVLGLDADPLAVVYSTERLKRFKKRALLREANFADLEKVLHKEGVQTLDKALFDLGWNSTQLQSGRGLSFMTDEPLTMSYGKKPASGFTAREILNEWEEKVIADVLFGYGEERYAKKIARAIVERRALAPLKTSIELAELIKDAVPPAYRRGRIHPATRSFQALRIAVNDELGVIERGLESAWKHLSCGGRIVVITFHSIEDRLVKQLFARFVKEEGGALVYKKPLVPTQQEIIHNPRARSAKLRAIEKICTR